MKKCTIGRIVTRFHFELWVKAGFPSHSLRIAVLNLAAGRSGSLEIPWQPKTGQ